MRPIANPYPEWTSGRPTLWPTIPGKAATLAICFTPGRNPPTLKKSDQFLILSLPVRACRNCAVPPASTFPREHSHRNAPTKTFQRWDSKCQQYLHIHIRLKPFFDPPAVVIYLLQVLLFIFIRPYHHIWREILQETKTLLSFSYRIFRQEIIGELRIFNEDYKGRGSPLEQKAFFGNSFTQCCLMVHLMQDKGVT